MRASELIGRDVLTADGQTAGSVVDLRLRETGRELGGILQLEVVALVVGRRNAGAALGYDRNEHQGPWLLRAALRRYHRSNRLVPIGQADLTHPGAVRLSLTLADFASLVGPERPRSGAVRQGGGAD